MDALNKNSQAQEIKVGGFGLQGHLTMDYPEVEEFEKSIVAFAGSGAKVMVTELDLSTLPFPLEEVTTEVSQSTKYKAHFDPYANGLSDSAVQVIHLRYIFFIKRYKTI